jgi:hypothetical protein
MYFLLPFKQLIQRLQRRQRIDIERGQFALHRILLAEQTQLKRPFLFRFMRVIAAL